MMNLKNTQKQGFVVTVAALLSGLSVVSAAPARVASQSDLVKMWKTGGLVGVADVSVRRQPFKKAMSFASPKKSAHPWDEQAGIGPKVALRQGDALVATFFVRSVKPAAGMVTFAVEGGPKYDRVVWQDLKVGSAWKKVTVPFVSKGAYGSGKWQFTFKMGTMAQTVQIANFQLVNYGPKRA